MVNITSVGICGNSSVPVGQNLQLMASVCSLRRAQHGRFYSFIDQRSWRNQCVWTKGSFQTGGRLNSSQTEFQSDSFPNLIFRAGCPHCFSQASKWDLTRFRLGHIIDPFDSLQSSDVWHRTIATYSSTCSDTCSGARLEWSCSSVCSLCRTSTGALWSGSLARA